MTFPGAISSLSGAISSRTSGFVCAQTLDFTANGTARAAKPALARKSRRFVRMHALLSALGTTRSMMRPIESPPEDAFHDQMVSAGGHADSYTEIDLPVRRHIQVYRRKKLLLLVMQRIDVPDWPVGSVILQAARNIFVEVIAEFRIRRKLHAIRNARKIEGPLKSRINGEIPPANLLIDDRPQLHCPSILHKRWPLIAKFHGQAHPHRPVPAIRCSHSWADMVAHPLPAVSAARAGENVKADFRPAIQPLGNFNGFVLRMVCWIDPL